MHEGMILLGLLVGLLEGLTGIGGGSFLAPGLVALFDIRPVAAVGTTLAIKGLMKALALPLPIVQRDVNYKVGGILVAGGVPAAMLTVALLWLLGHYGFAINRWTHWALALGAATAGVAILLQPLYSYRFQDGDVRVLASLKVRLTASILIGIAGGFILGLTAIGSSALTIPVLGLLYLMPIRRVAGTDVFHTAIAAASAALVAGVVGHMAWGALANVALGAVPGLIAGLWLARRKLLPDYVYRTLLGVLVAALGVWMLVNLFRGGGTPGL